MTEWDDAGAASASTSPLDAGRVLGDRYRLDEQLAERGTTRTWRAFDTKLSRAVLVHLLPAGDPCEEEALDAARRAATAIDSRFLRVLDALPADDAAGGPESLIVCEFLAGKSLERLLAEGPLSGLEAAWIVRELADALTAQHGLGNFHERLDLDTVVITPTGSVKIVGFLIDAALHPEQGRALTWSEREASDVRALGKILYACLVSEWPLDPGTSGPDFGLPPAQVDPHGWITPRQVQAGVSPLLDAITDRVLSPVPRTDEQPIRTASQLLLALSKVLGTADASPDLERRLHQPRAMVRPDTRSALAAAHEAIARGSAPSDADPGPATAIWDADATAPFTPVPPPRDADATAPFTSVPLPRDADATAPVTPVPPPRDAVLTPVTTTAAPASTATEPVTARRRRWRPLVVGLIVLAVVVAALQLLGDRDPLASSPGTTADRVVHAISGADDFDPESDGGNDEENPNQLTLAYDDDPSTAWRTLTYLNRAKLGGLKPGVGVVFDLGRPVSVGQVTLTMIGTPTAIELRVPTSDASPAPMTGIGRWTRVASEATAPTTAVLTPAKPVTTRYLLVYLTSLPNVGSNKYQAAIAEIEVTS